MKCSLWMWTANATQKQANTCIGTFGAGGDCRPNDGEAPGSNGQCFIEFAAMTFYLDYQNSLHNIRTSVAKMKKMAP